MSTFLPSDLIASLLNYTHQNDTTLNWTWKETPHSHIFKFDLPGYTKSDINIHIHSNTRVLHIATKTDKNPDKDDTSDNNVTWHCRERASTRFSKEFRLPKNASADGIEASMKDGVLVVTVPKELSDENGKNVEEGVKKKKSIEIEGKDADDDVRRGGKDGLLGRCFVCFKS